MVDFIEILKKTIEGFGETNSETRQKVYQKARETIEIRLHSIQPPLSPKVIEEKRSSLEKAIVDVEQYFSKESTSSFEDLGKVFDSLGTIEKKSLSFSPSMTKVLDSSDVDLHDSVVEPFAKKSQGFFSKKKWLILILLGLLIPICGIVYFFWEKEINVLPLLLEEKKIEPSKPLKHMGSNSQKDLQTLDSQKSKEDDFTQKSSVETKKSEHVEEKKTAQKFTQRLHSDGTETDPGSFVRSSNTLEGSSSSVLEKQKLSVPVLSEKAIFYEENTTSSASSLVGSVTWSTVYESPGLGKPEEPAIHAESIIPDKGIRLQMTIRRNADHTLPASHIIEMIFITSEKNSEDSIDNVVRLSLKGTEQDTGFPLSGMPAKISDGFFLIALDETSKAVRDNIDLLSTKNWIDIPMVYKSGKRALITLQKGDSGEKIFDHVLKIWQESAYNKKF